MSSRETMRALLLAAAMFTAAAAPAAAKPERIVSLYLCADQFLLQLVERERIVSLSHLVRHEPSSYFAGRAGDIPINYGLAEEAIALRPDLVVTGPFAYRGRAELLRRFGIAVLELAPVETLADIRRETLRVAEALGEAERGRALVAEMDARLAAIERPAEGPRPVAAVYMASGVAIGHGTLVDELLEAAGFANLAARHGLAGYGYLAMEQLIVAQPDLVVMDRERPRSASLAAERLRHPALRTMFAGRHSVALPERLWTCPGTFTVEAVEILARARGRLAAAAP